MPIETMYSDLPPAAYEAAAQSTPTLRDGVAQSFYEGLRLMNRAVNAHDMVRYLGLPADLTRSVGFLAVANAASEAHERENASLHAALCLPEKESR